eukprot:CAMPEP_0114311352 /NCGR_PEP_ID=MMETSP0059-20121206/19777_1 /TAXON_ID=36894 /ORGANISM="Pyramimonas parkeae, Strain CCMP726" /LENGTH=85 /DNA_ID=CAMNT_0001435517 /DNA_START=452 /DNA_END=709 /DNA_ORIENTATION=+
MTLLGQHIISNETVFKLDVHSPEPSFTPSHMQEYKKPSVNPLVNHNGRGIFRVGVCLHPMLLHDLVEHRGQSAGSRVICIQSPKS